MSVDSRREQAAEWLFRLRDPGVAPDEIHEWLAWCEASAANAEEFSRIQSIWQQTSGLEKCPPCLSESFLAAPARKNVFRHLPWTLAAATATVAIVAGAWWLAIRHPALHDDVTIATTTGINRDFVLPDGTAVTVAAGSRLATVYTAAQRRIRLEQGEAFFQVRKERNRPFIVEALNATVTAVGTAFNVRAEQGVVKVAVTEGTVDVDRTPAGRFAPPQTGSPPENIRLAAGHQVIFAPDDPEPVVVSVDADSATAWKGGTLQFMHEPLSSVVAAVNRYAAVPIRLNGENTGALHYTGTVAVDRIEDWLRGLPDIFQVTIRQQEGAGIAIEPASTAVSF